METSSATSDKAEAAANIALADGSFKNQGQCVSYVQSNGKSGGKQ